MALTDTRRLIEQRDQLSDIRNALAVNVKKEANPKLKAQFNKTWMGWRYFPNPFNNEQFSQQWGRIINRLNELTDDNIRVKEDAALTLTAGVQGLLDTETAYKADTGKTKTAPALSKDDKSTLSTYRSEMKKAEKEIVSMQKEQTQLQAKFDKSTHQFMSRLPNAAKVAYAVDLGGVYKPWVNDMLLATRTQGEGENEKPLSSQARDAFIQDVVFIRTNAVEIHEMFINKFLLDETNPDAFAVVLLESKPLFEFFKLQLLTGAQQLTPVFEKAIEIAKTDEAKTNKRFDSSLVKSLAAIEDASSLSKLSTIETSQMLGTLLTESTGKQLISADAQTTLIFGLINQLGLVGVDLTTQKDTEIPAKREADSVIVNILFNMPSLRPTLKAIITAAMNGRFENKPADILEAADAAAKETYAKELKAYEAAVPESLRFEDTDERNNTVDAFREVMFNNSYVFKEMWDGAYKGAFANLVPQFLTAASAYAADDDHQGKLAKDLVVEFESYIEMSKTNIAYETSAGKKSTLWESYIRTIDFLNSYVVTWPLAALLAMTFTAEVLDNWLDMNRTPEGGDKYYKSLIQMDGDIKNNRIESVSLHRPANAYSGHYASVRTTEVSAAEVLNNCLDMNRTPEGGDNGAGAANPSYAFSGFLDASVSLSPGPKNVPLTPFREDTDPLSKVERGIAFN